MDSTVLMQAAVRGNRRLVKLLIKFGADVQATDMFGITALMKAAERGHCECVNCLIQAGAHVNEKDMSGNTALMKATERGNIDCSELLTQSEGSQYTILNNEADVNRISCV